MKLPHLNPVIRISFGLSLFVITLFLGLEMLGIFPDPQQAILDSRQKTCESLAIYGAMAIQNKEFGAIQTTIDLLRQRNQDILSAALRKKNGKVVAITGDHERHWNNDKDSVSTQQNVKVPLFLAKGNDRWGTFEVSFAAMHPNSIHSIWARPMVKTIVLSLPLAFVGFFLIMKKTLRHLDPSAVVPERVKHTLDSLVEGVILMDHNERIVLTNKAFEENLGDGHTIFIGRKASELDWQSSQASRPVEEFPWQRAMQDGDSQAPIPLYAKDSRGGKRTFMVSGAPILDANGNTRGALATFNDVTQVEEQNSKLQKMLNALKKSRDEVRRQNHALQLLATRDPLTECLNRRAFYERFETEFSRAGRYKHELACLMLDIDHFKWINDSHGHLVGDKVLQQVSSILRSNLRDSDVVCRYGGEEFSILLPETGALGALKTAERIRRVISDKETYGAQVTVSLGISALEFKPGNPTDLLNQADKALYHAKNSGRDKTVVYSEIPTALREDKTALRDDNRGDSGEEQVVDAVKQAVDLHIPHHVVKALMLALEHRDAATAEHCGKVGDLCVAAARSMMSINECAVLEIAGMLHDIGKLGVSDAILLKPGPLDEKERQAMQEHERLSVDLIASTLSSPELVEIVKHRSQWFDGSNPVNGAQLMGEQIPLGARILHIADAFDAMVSGRPYRKARSYEEACKELRRCAGTQFDPMLVEHFITVVKDRDDARRSDGSAIPRAIQLEIGYEIESLLVAVNTASWGDLKTAAKILTALAEKHNLNRIAETVSEIESAVAENKSQMEIIKLASKLPGISDHLGAFHGEKEQIPTESVIAHQIQLESVHEIRN